MSFAVPDRSGPGRRIPAHGFPLIPGTGKRLFDGAKRTQLRLTGITHVGPDGVTVQRYVPA
jgi:hypothetical protein